MNTLDTLRAVLPAWHFEPYGSRGAIACFPPQGTGHEAFEQLYPHAVISSVCGPMYVVTQLRVAAFQPVALPAEHLAEYDAAAQWCATRGIKGNVGDTLPPNMATDGALRFIQADPEAFQERIRQCAYALAMNRHAESAVRP